MPKAPRSSKIVLTGPVGYFTKEDNGAALSASIRQQKAIPDDGCFWIEFHSWNCTGFEHPTLISLKGKTVKVTIEVLPQSWPQNC